MDQEAYKGHHDEHRLGDVIKQKAFIDLKVTKM